VKNRIRTSSKALIVFGFAIMLFGVLLMVKVEAMPNVIGGVVIAMGFLFFIGGVGTFMVTTIIYMVSKNPKQETGKAMAGEYGHLMESGQMMEHPAQLPARRFLTGKIDDVPLGIRLYYNPTARYGISKRTEFFSPFGDKVAGFKLYPTGEEVRSDVDVKVRFAQMFYVPGSDYEAFKKSGLSIDAMGALMDFLDGNGGVLSMDENGLYWNMDVIDFGGFGADIASEFASVSKLVGECLLGGGGVDSATMFKNITLDPPKNFEGSAQPIYTTKKTMIAIVAMLLGVGGLSLLGAVFAYADGGGGDAFIMFIIISAFTLTPGVIMVPLLIYHLVTSQPASRG
jgi:hypothetical protein